MYYYTAGSMMKFDRGSSLPWLKRLSGFSNLDISKALLMGPDFQITYMSAILLWPLAKSNTKSYAPQIVIFPFCLSLRK